MYGEQLIFVTIRLLLGKQFLPNEFANLNLKNLLAKFFSFISVFIC